jgi:hypothetical protein
MTRSVTVSVRAVAMLIAFASAAQAQSRLPLTHELLWSFPRVGAPVPSPDGKWVVFAMTETRLRSAPRAYRSSLPLKRIGAITRIT